jgi:hypothetical protein
MTSVMPSWPASIRAYAALTASRASSSVAHWPTSERPDLYFSLMMNMLCSPGLYERGLGFCRFGNPDFVAYAESFGAKGYRIASAAELLPTLKNALADNTVSVIACPVDYTANTELIRTLGDLDESLS